MLLLFSSAGLTATSDLALQIVKAAARGDVQEVRNLLSKGAGVNFTAKWNHTARYWAVDEGRTAAVKLLVEKDADATIRNREVRSALELAKFLGNEETLSILEEVGTGPPAGIPPDKLPEPAVTMSSQDMSLQQAAAEGNARLIEMLINSGANPTAVDKDGDTPLMWASDKGCEKCVKLLLKAGAQVDGQERKTRSPALMIACLDGHAGVVKLLLDAGANADLTAANQVTALMIAASGGHMEAVKLLVEHGAKTDCRDTIGRTALDYATWKGHKEVVHFLTAHTIRKESL